MLEVDHARRRGELTVRRHFGEPLRLEHLVLTGLADAGRTIPLDPPCCCSAGESFTFFF